MMYLSLNLKTSKVFVVLLLILFLYSCSQSNEVGIMTKDSVVHVKVEFARSAEEQVKGLMFRDSLGENAGMFFLFSDEKSLSFWMKNTKIGLDMIFVSENLKIVDIKENFAPCIKNPCEVYYSKPAKYVLEVNSGFVKRHNISINDVVSF